MKRADVRPGMDVYIVNSAREWIHQAERVEHSRWTVTSEAGGPFYHKLGTYWNPRYQPDPKGALVKVEHSGEGQAIRHEYVALGQIRGEYEAVAAVRGPLIEQRRAARKAERQAQEALDDSRQAVIERADRLGYHRILPVYDERGSVKLTVRAMAALLDEIELLRAKAETVNHPHDPGFYGMAGTEGA